MVPYTHNGDEALAKVVSLAVAAAMKESEIATPAPGQGKAITDASKYFTVTYLQSILGIAALIIVWSGAAWTSHTDALNREEVLRERTARTEYQNEVSLKDRSDLRLRQDAIITRLNELDIRIEQRTSSVSERLAALEVSAGLRRGR